MSNPPKSTRARALIVDNIDHQDVAMDSADVLLDDYEGIETPGPQLSSKQAIEFERFMNEKVVVAFAPVGEGSTEPDSFPLSVGNFDQLIKKGNTYTIPRSALEVLINARKDSYRQEKTAGGDPSDITLFKETRLTHSYALVQDTPEGRAWHQRKIGGVA